MSTGIADKIAELCWSIDSDYSKTDSVHIDQASTWKKCILKKLLIIVFTHASDLIKVLQQQEGGYKVVQAVILQVALLFYLFYEIFCFHLDCLKEDEIAIKVGV